MTEQMELADFLKEARILIALPDNWVKHTSWATEDGLHVQVNSSENIRSRVARRCMMGALAEVELSHPPPRTLTVKATRLLESAIEAKIGGMVSVPAFNDADLTTHEDVLDVFDQAIAEAQR